MKQIKTFTVVCLLILVTFSTCVAENKQTSITAILGALDCELEMIKKETINQQTVIVSGMAFTIGELKGQRIVFARTGMGKVNAAMITALLINHFKPKEVIFTGIAGGLNPALLPGDVVIGEKTIQHDLIFLKPDSFEQFIVWNPINGKNNPSFFAADSRLLSLAEKVKKNIKLEKIITGDGERVPQIIKGVIVTGDMFVGSSAKNTELHNYFKADAVEMEGAAVAQVCYQQNVPCLVIRSLSDSANDNIEKDFEKFYKVAAHNSAKFTIEVIALMSKSNICEVHNKSYDNSRRSNFVAKKSKL